MANKFQHYHKSEKLIQLPDGRVLAVYGYRKDPWGVRGCISDDGEKWLLENEFAIRTGGAAEPNIFLFWHIGYPTVTQCKDGTVVAAYHEYTKGNDPIQCMWITKFSLWLNSSVLTSNPKILWGIAKN